MKVQYVVMRQVVDKHVALLPLTEPVLLILLGLADQPRHGYAILQEIERSVTAAFGSVQGLSTAHCLLEVVWIERFKEEDISRGKQAYRLTLLGQRQLQREVNRLKHLTRVASLRVAREEV